MGQGRIRRSEGARHRLAYQVKPADQVYSFLDLGKLFMRKQMLEHVSGGGEADDDNIARVRDVIAEQQSHYPEPDFLGDRAINNRVSSGTPRSGRKEERGGLFRLDDAPLDQ